MTRSGFKFRNMDLMRAFVPSKQHFLMNYSKCGLIDAPVLKAKPGWLFQTCQTFCETLGPKLISWSLSVSKWTHILRIEGTRLSSSPLLKFISDCMMTYLFCEKQEVRPFAGIKWFIGKSMVWERKETFLCNWHHCHNVYAPCYNMGLGQRCHDLKKEDSWDKLIQKIVLIGIPGLT